MIFYFKNANIESFPGTTQFMNMLIIFPIQSIKIVNIVLSYSMEQ